MVVSSALSTTTSLSRLRIGWSHPEALAKGDYFWSDILTSDAIHLLGGDLDALSDTRFWNYYTKVGEVLGEGSESTAYFSSLGEPWNLIRYSLAGLQPEVQPIARGQWNLPSPAYRDFSESRTVRIVRLLDLAGQYSLPAEVSSHGGKTYGGDANQVLTILEGTNSIAAERLRKLSKLEPDWNGYGGLAPTEEAIAGTAGLLIEIHKLTHGRLESPFIAPLPDGGLELEWELASGVEVMLVIPPTGRDIRYLLDEPTTLGEVIQSEGTLWKDITLHELISRLTH